MAAAPKCVSCSTTLEFLGQLPVRTGGAAGGWHLLLGEWADMTEGVVPLDIFRCPKCRRLEFYDLDASIPAR
jgi:hypothetical protein